jgi:hypothetical protein
MSWRMVAGSSGGVGSSPSDTMRMSAEAHASSVVSRRMAARSGAATSVPPRNEPTRWLSVSLKSAVSL